MFAFLRKKFNDWGIETTHFVNCVVIAYKNQITDSSNFLSNLQFCICFYLNECFF